MSCITHVVFTTCTLFKAVLKLSLHMFSDGERGSGNITVDKQRNRVLAAGALKKAEDLGDKSKSDTFKFSFDKETTKIS